MELRTQQSGRLEDVSPLDLLQSLGIYRRAGHVTFFHPHGQSRLWFLAGEIVDAESGALRGAAALYRIATHDRGEFRVEVTGEPRGRTIELSGSPLIFEAARRLDEGQRLRARLPADDAVLAVATPSAEEPGAGEARARVAALFGAGASLGEVLERSPLGELETLQQVAGLVDTRRLVATGAVREAGLELGARTSWLGAEVSQPLVPSPSYLDDLDEPARPRRWIPAVAAAAAMAILGLAVILGGGSSTEADAALAAGERPVIVVDAVASDVRPSSETEATPREPALVVGGVGASPRARDAGAALATSPPPSSPPPSTAGPARRSRSRARAEPTPAEPPASRSKAAPKAQDAARLLVEARRAYAAGRGETAYQLASRSQWLQPTGEAAELMALSACQRGRADAALEALRTVPVLRRASVRATCKQAYGVRLKLGSSGR